MSIEEKQKIADEANMIVDGYSFTYKDNNVFVVNLNTNDSHTLLMTKAGKTLETNMDPIEETIALEIWDSDKEFMEG